jgi:uncharacterized membrane protein YeiB
MTTTLTRDLVGETSPADLADSFDTPPIERPDRVRGVDIARGLAMLGMITVHVFVGTNEPPGRVGEWLLQMPSGRASVLFFTLSGVALSLVARRGSSSATTPALLKRGALLLVGGWFVMSTFWSASILHQYGAMFLLAPWLLRRRSRTLLVLAGVAFLVGPFVAATGSWAVDPWATNRYGVHGWLVGTLSSSLFSLYALAVWVGFFMVGIALGRLRLTRRQGAAMLFGGAAACLAITFPIDAVNRRIDSPWSDAKTASDTPAEPVAASDVSSCDEFFGWKWQSAGDGETITEPADADQLTFDPTPCIEKMKTYERPPFGDAVTWRTWTSITPHANSAAWALQATTIAIAVLGLCLVLPRRATKVLWPLAALGSISLTAYVLHMALVQDLWILMGNEGSGAGLWAQFGSLVAIWSIELTVACFIRWRWRRGPLEWLLAQFGQPAAPSVAPARSHDGLTTP